MMENIKNLKIDIDKKYNFVVNNMMRDDYIRTRKFYPQYEGQFIKGLFSEWDYDDYGNLVPVLEVFKGCNYVERVILPSHKDLVNQLSNVRNHDYVSIYYDGKQSLSYGYNRYKHVYIVRIIDYDLYSNLSVREAHPLYYGEYKPPFMWENNIQHQLGPYGYYFERDYDIVHVSSDLDLNYHFDFRIEDCSDVGPFFDEWRKYTWEGDFPLIELDSTKLDVISLKEFLLGVTCDFKDIIYGTPIHTSFKNFDRFNNILGYSDWHQKVLQKYNFKCDICGSSENLHVHHLENFWRHLPIGIDVDNGVSLCSDCHSQYHKIEGYDKNRYEYFKANW